MARRTRLNRAILLGLGAPLIAASVSAQQQLQKVEITGSAIKRLEAETAVPVEIFTRRDIERIGATTVTELVKSISSLDIDDQGELTGNSPSGSGTTNLQIRGLSERNLLILLNGRRLPINALHDGSGAGAAVDVNSIPLSAIDRIEVLKDGGSAIYGADAVAGVINFITRKNYNGLEARIGYGQSSRSDAKEKTAGIVFGTGDYDKDGFNVLGALDLFKRDALPRTARDITSSADWRRFADGKGVDGRSTFHPSGNIVAGPGNPGQLAPCPAEDLPLVGGLCRFDFSKSILDSINAADRSSGMLIGNFKLGDLRAFTEITYSKSENTFLAQPAPGTYTDNQGRTIRARFMQPGPRTTQRESSLLQLVAGLEGSLGNGMEWDIAVGQGTSKVQNNDSNYLALDRFVAAINAGQIDPTSMNNPSALVDSLRLTPNRRGKSVLKFANAKLTGEVGKLPAGPIGYAVGFQANQESLSDQPDANQQAGNIFGSIAQSAVDRSRNFSAIFGELAVPIARGVESQVALRHDRYPDKSSTSPKFAIKYQPSNAFLIRGSYAESFLAPSLKQLYGGQDQGAESVSSTNGVPHPVCAAFPTLAGTCNNFAYQEVSGSNPNLRPETGKTFNLGIVVEPIPAVSAGLDLWLIKKRDEIDTPDVETAVANGATRISPLGEAQVLVTNQNLGRTRVQGADFDLRVRIADTPLGRVSIRNAATYYIKNLQPREVGGPLRNYNGTFLNPKWRNTFAVNFETGKWATTVAARTVSSMKDTDQPEGEAEYTTARKVDSYTEVDLNVQFEVQKGFTLSGGVKNMFDKMPPYSNEGTQNQYGSLGFPWIYSPRGRFFFVGANYKFY